MAEEQKPQRWWQTVPGILTATAGIITAVTGLIVALHQAGVFGTANERIPQAQNHTSTPPRAAKPPAGRETVSPATPPATTGQTHQYPRTLAAGTEVRVSGAVYTILAVQLDRYNVEKLTLRFTVRMTNNERYPANFWADTFRLLVDGVPRAPLSGLNTLVAGHSAEEGEVEFVIPAATPSAVLQIRHADESAEIPVDLSPKPAATEQTK